MLKQDQQTLLVNYSALTIIPCQLFKNQDLIFFTRVNASRCTILKYKSSDGLRQGKDYYYQQHYQQGNRLQALLVARQTKKEGEEKESKRSHQIVNWSDSSRQGCIYKWHQTEQVSLAFFQFLLLEKAKVLGISNLWAPYEAASMISLNVMIIDG